MNPLTLRSLSTSQKENKNRLNQVISPEPAYPLKISSNQRKVFVPSAQLQYCQNQDGRTATHTVTQSHQTFNYCEKCSIIAASKGFPVQKICNKPQSISQNSSSKKMTSNSKKHQSKNKINTKDLRLNSVNQLKQEIFESQEKLQSKFQQVQDLLMKSGDKYTHLIEQVTSYFQVIEQMIEYQKYLAYNKVLSERVQNEKDVRQFKDYISSALHQLRNINQDLIENHDIVFTVSDQQFNFILNNYHSTVSHIPDILTVDPQIQVFNSIQFPLLWENLDNLDNCIQLQNSTFLASSDLLLCENQKTNLIMSAIDLENDSDNIQRLLEENEAERDAKIMQNYDSNSQRISQHSFSNSSALIRGNNNLESKLVKSCQKQIFVQNGFSLASSIVGNDEQSFEEEEQQLSSALSRNFNCKANLFKNYQQNQIERLQESLGQYFATEESLPINQTLNQKSQTFLLNY